MAPTHTLPETILQFGSGRFLRGFADLFIHHGNTQGQAVGRVVVVQSTGDGRAAGFTQSGGRYGVAVRGLEAGQVVDRVEHCESVSRAIHAGTAWPEVLAFATSPTLTTILSNTTEAGYALDPADTPQTPVPTSFPAKLLAVLRARFEANLPGVTVVPCELLEGNAALLRGLVAGLALRHGAGDDLTRYITEECVWLHTLVDRIVTAAPVDHKLSADPLAVTAEPFAFWALEDHARSQFRLQHPAITRTATVEPYFLRKVRILNAAHTALVIRARPRGFAIVRDAVLDSELGPWLQALLREEIVPTLEGRVEGGEAFAWDTLERFQNPFLEHKLADIALHHESKIAVRLVPTEREFTAKFGRPPQRLRAVLAEAGVG